jgi:hypothetical protein
MSPRPAKFTVDIHTIIDREKLIVAEGVPLPNRPWTLNGAKTIARKRLGGSLWNAPEEVAHICGPSEDSWWFVGAMEKRSGRYVTCYLKLVRHVGGELTVIKNQTESP